MTTRLVICGALLLSIGVLTPVFADPSLKAESVSVGLTHENPGRHLALGHYKQNPSLALPDKASDRALTFSAGRAGDDVYLHGFRDAQSVQATPNPEPATMVLLGSGLPGVVAAVRKRRGASR